MKHKEIVAYVFQEHLELFTKGESDSLVCFAKNHRERLGIKILVPLPEKQVLISESEFEIISGNHPIEGGRKIFDEIKKRFEA